MIAHKEDNLFTLQSLLFAAKYLSTFKLIYLLRENLSPKEVLLVTILLQLNKLKLSMMTILSMFGVTVTVMIATVKGSKLTVLSFLYVFPKWQII